MVPIYFIAIKTNWLQTCILARVLLQREWRMHIETESDRRQQGDGGKERAGRSQEVGKENEMGGGGREQRMTTSTCPNQRLSSPSDAPMLGGREEKRDREGGTQKAMAGLSLSIFVSPCLPHSPPSDGESSPWATGHVVYSLMVAVFFIIIIILGESL